MVTAALSQHRYRYYHRYYYYICVLILLYMCPHTSICAPVDYFVSSNYYIRVRILLYMGPHTAIYVSSHCYICVLILVYVSEAFRYCYIWMCVSSYYCHAVYTARPHRPLLEPY